MARSFLFLHLIALLSSTTRIEVAAEWTPSLTGNPGQVDAQTAEKLERMLQPQLRGSNPSSTSSSASILVGGGKSRGDGKDDTAQRKLQYYPQYYPPYYPQYYGYGPGPGPAPKGPPKGPSSPPPPPSPPGGGGGGGYPGGKGNMGGKGAMPGYPSYPPGGKGNMGGKGVMTNPPGGKGVMTNPPGGKGVMTNPPGGKGVMTNPPGGKGNMGGKGAMPGYPMYPPPPGGKGNMGGGSKGKGNMGGKGAMQLNYPSLDDIPLVDDAVYDDAFLQSGNCETVTFNETFFFLSPVSTIPVGSGPTAVGSQYIFNQNIYAPDGTMITDTVVSGVCTRTSQTGVLGTSGGGNCQFNFVDVSGNYTVAAQGYLDTLASKMTAGKMVVTGGSGSMVSVVGDANVIPVDNTGVFTTADLFTATFAYYIQANFGVIICPTKYY